jgi:phage-related minor tail protein
MSFVDDGFAIADGEWGRATERVRRSTDALGVSATAFAGTMTRAFAGAITGGKQFDDVLKSLALRLSNMTVRAAFQPLAKNFAKGLNDVFAGLFGGGAGNAPVPVLPFASGGVIGAPSYFPLAAGGLGLAGEAGPEAIMPLARGSDGRLGVAVSGAPAQPNIIVQISTPDPDSFRRSEAYITGQIARAVARGQRGL